METTSALPMLQKDTNSNATELLNLAGEAMRNILDTLGAQEPKSVAVAKGSHRSYNDKEFTESMKSFGSYKGVAIPLPWLGVDRVSCTGYAPDIEAIRTHGNEKFGFKKHLDALKDAPFNFGHVGTIIVPVLSKEYSEIHIGKLVRLNGDLDFFGLLLSVNDFVKAQPDEHSSIYTHVQHLVCHIPVDFVFYQMDPTIERIWFKDSFQHTENIKLKEESEGACAWQVCCQFARVRSDNKTLTGDETAAAVHSFFAQNIQFAKGAEYACHSGDANTKMAENILLCYDKAVNAKVEHLCLKAKMQFGMRSMLTQMSKFVTICQKAGSCPQKCRWLISWVYLRLSEGTLSTTLSLSDLKSKVVPIMLQSFDLINEVPKLFMFPKQSDGTSMVDMLWVNMACERPLWLSFAKRGDVDKSYGVMFDLQDSTKQALRWCERLNHSEFDGTLKEINDNWKSHTPLQRLGYEKFEGFLDSLKAKHDEDLAAMQPEPEPLVTPVVSDSIQTTRAAEINAREVVIEGMPDAPPPNKDQLIEKEYEKHARECLTDNIQFADRPRTKPDWNTALSTHSFIANRGDCVWIYDADLDKEPIPGERQSTANTCCPPDLTLVENMVSAMEEVLYTSDAKDVILLSDGRHPRNLRDMQKLCKKYKEEWPVTITYKEVEYVEKAGESAARAKRPIVEMCNYISAVPLQFRPDPRLYFTTTTVAANVIQMADVLPPNELPRVQKSIKEAIHGLSGMPKHERDVAPTKLLPLQTHEKSTRLWEEHFHALNSDRAVTSSPGSGPLLKSFLQSKTKALVFCKHAALQQHLEKYCVAFILNQAKTNARSRFFLDRSKIIKRLGLEPDHTTNKKGEESSDEDDAAPIIKNVSIPANVVPNAIQWGGTIALPDQTTLPTAGSSESALPGPGGGSSSSAIETRSHGPPANLDGEKLNVLEKAAFELDLDDRDSSGSGEYGYDPMQGLFSGVDDQEEDSGHPKPKTKGKGKGKKGRKGKQSGKKGKSEEPVTEPNQPQKSILAVFGRKKKAAEDPGTSESVPKPKRQRRSQAKAGAIPEGGE